MTPDPRDDVDSGQRQLRRRRVLAASGLAISAAIAGCGGSDDEGDDDGADDEVPEDTPEDDPEPDEDTPTPDQDDDDDDVEPAEFQIVNVNHPDEVDVGESHTIEIAVENVGGEAGTYNGLLELSIAGVDEYENLGRMQVDIEAGETETWVSNEVDYGEPATLQFRIEDTEFEYTVAAATIDAKTFSGTGQTVESGIDIADGLTVVEASHDGDSNFQVKLVDGSEYDDLFINVIGSFDGAQADLMDAGEYMLDVSADGSWDITIRQPRSADGDGLPATYSGNGPDVVGPAQFGGTGVAAGDHDGSSNFQARIYPATGSWGESLFNEIGQFDGETTFSFEGVGWVDVNADGNWTIELE